MILTKMHQILMF